MAGYSKKSLIAKLGVKPGWRAVFLKAPKGYGRLLGKLPTGVRAAKRLDRTVDFVQFFATKQRELAAAFPRLKRALVKNGMLWVAWPEGSSGLKTDLTETAVQKIGLQHGLVDVKVAAIDATWSGLKFVWRVRDR